MAETSDIEDARAVLALRDLGVPHVARRYPPARSLAEAAEMRGLRPADIVKTMMVRAQPVCAQFNAHLLVQIHDELVFEIAPGEHERVEALAREQMGGAYPLDVPLEVSVGYGRSWDAAAH